MTGKEDRIRKRLRQLLEIEVDLMAAKQSEEQRLMKIYGGVMTQAECERLRNSPRLRDKQEFLERDKAEGNLRDLKAQIVSVAVQIEGKQAELNALKCSVSAINRNLRERERDKCRGKLDGALHRRNARQDVGRAGTPSVNNLSLPLGPSGSGSNASRNEAEEGLDARSVSSTLSFGSVFRHVFLSDEAEEGLDEAEEGLDEAEEGLDEAEEDMDARSVSTTSNLGSAVRRIDLSDKEEEEEEE